MSVGYCLHCGSRGIYTDGSCDNLHCSSKKRTVLFEAEPVGTTILLGPEDPPGSSIPEPIRRDLEGVRTMKDLEAFMNKHGHHFTPTKWEIRVPPNNTLQVDTFEADADTWEHLQGLVDKNKT